MKEPGSNSKPIEHPSIAQRKKLVAARRQRLAQALRENLRKRKEQIRERLKLADEERKLD